MKKMSIKKGDVVVVLSGKDKGKQGAVLEVMPKESKVVVEKVNVVTRHQKARRQGEQSGIVSATSPPASATRSRATRRSASARSAAPRSERGGV